MNKGQTKKVIDAAKEAEKPPSPYEPTPAEAETLKAYRAARAKRGPRLKVSGSDINIDHPNPALGSILLMKAIGSTDGDFLDGLTKQLVNAGSQGPKADEHGSNFMLAVVKGVEPRDQIEAMLAAQMAAVHMASMTFARRLAHVETVPQQDSASNAFNKLARTFAAQVEALRRYRSGGEQKMTVQHVHVAEGGQAIVGNVSASPEGVGRGKNQRINPMHSLPMHQALRCHAKSKRSGLQCRAPAVRGYAVCRMHGAGGGAPKGNRNAIKHGEFAAKALALKRDIHALARMTRETLVAIK